MSEWIRFWITAILLVLGLTGFTLAVTGVYRFGFVMNRLHAAGIGDTLGIFCVLAGLAVSAGPCADTLKMGLLVLFLWFTSPVSSHFLSQIEYYTNARLYDHTDRELKELGK